MTQPPLTDLFPKNLQRSIEFSKFTDEEETFGHGWETELPKPILNTIRQHQSKGGLNFMGEGSTRAVFDLGGGRVLKVSKNHGGVSQTQTEISISKRFGKSKFLPRVWKHDPNGRWIIMEEVKPATSEAHDLLVVDLPDNPRGSRFEDNLLNYLDDPEMLEGVLPYLEPLQVEFLEFIRASGISPDDVYPDHMGKTHDGRLVLMDFGLAE